MPSVDPGGCDMGAGLGAGGPILSMVTMGSLAGREARGPSELVLAPLGLPASRTGRDGQVWGGGGPHSPNTPPRRFSLAHVSLREGGPSAERVGWGWRGALVRCIGDCRAGESPPSASGRDARLTAPAPAGAAGTGRARGRWPGLLSAQVCAGRGQRRLRRHVQRRHGHHVRRDRAARRGTRRLPGAAEVSGRPALPPLGPGMLKVDAEPGGRAVRLRRCKALSRANCVAPLQTQRSGASGRPDGPGAKLPAFVGGTGLVESRVGPFKCLF